VEEETMGQLVEERVRRRPGSWRDDLPVAATAAVVAGLGWACERLAGIDLAVRTGSGTQHVNVVSVIVTSVVVAMVAGGLLRVLERRTPDALRIWTMVAGGVLVVSLAGPLGAVTLDAGLALATLHVLVGAVVILGLRRSRRGRVA
jgi:hypothetical protein